MDVPNESNDDRLVNEPRGRVVALENGSGFSSERISWSPDVHRPVIVTAYGHDRAMVCPAARCRHLRDVVPKRFTVV